MLESSGSAGTECQLPSALLRVVVSTEACAGPGGLRHTDRFCLASQADWKCACGEHAIVPYLVPSPELQVPLCSGTGPGLPLNSWISAALLEDGC